MNEFADTTGAAPDSAAVPAPPPEDGADGSADRVGLSGGRAVATSGAGAGFAATEVDAAGVVAAGAADGPALLATAFGFAAGVGTGAAGAVVAVAVVSEPPIPTFLARLLKKPPSDEADATRVEGTATTGSSDAANSEAE